MNGPQRLILIRAGRYDYANVEICGSLQIVGPNNTGKTTLINTLQFLYLDDRRHMDFGSYSLEQTRDYYFPGQYSYVLFEIAGVRGRCVFGWRGQSRVAGGEPERFFFEGMFDPADFFEDNYRVREPRDVSVRLAIKEYKVLKSAPEHREFLLLPTKGDSSGIGVVALRDNDRYPQFRETLKNLLSLSTISQDQMRAQLMMLAGLSTEKHALDVRELFGSDYDRIVLLKQKLLRFKKFQQEIEKIVENGSRRLILRNELSHHWRSLQEKRAAFEQHHEKRLAELRSAAKEAAQQVEALSKKIDQERKEKEELVASKGSISIQIRQIAEQRREFSGFEEHLARLALKNMREQAREMEVLLEDAEKETRDNVEQKLRHYKALVAQTQRMVALFDEALVTFLRQHLDEAGLFALSRVFNFDLLEQTIGEDGIKLLRADDFLQLLQLVSRRIENDVYRDNNIELPLPTARRNLTELENVTVVRERLAEQESALRQCERTLRAIQERESFLAKLTEIRDQISGRKDANGCEVIEGMERRIFRFEEYQRVKNKESQFLAELQQTEQGIKKKQDLIEQMERQKESERTKESAAKSQIESDRTEFANQIKKFNECSPPMFAAISKPLGADVPGDFVASVERYLGIQRILSELDQQISARLHNLEIALGPDFTGADEDETIGLLREELEALPEREEVLRRDWEHQLTNLQAVFDEVLKSIADIKSAADRLNRDLANVRISNLVSLRMDVLEQGDFVGPMRRLANIQQPGLFDDSTGLESTISTFRQRFESNPLVRYPDLFTLSFTVKGEDGKSHVYQDFRQVESDGTTIAIKVLFNLIVLRSLLREDSHRNLLCEIPFFLDEIRSLDPANRHAILSTARTLGFIAITAAPEPVSEVDALYFLEPRQGRIILKNRHRMHVMTRQRGA